MSLFDEEDAQDDSVSGADNKAAGITGGSALHQFTHPRGMNFCLGYDGLEKTLLELYKAGRIPHAIVLSGPKGIGKATMAYRFARFLLKHGQGDVGQDSLFGAPSVPETMDVAATDPVFARIQSGGHPDFLSIERAFDDDKNRYKSSVDVDSIRKVTPFLRKTSGDGGWRVVIIDDADTMNRNAQNALLKILEEPPAKALLILVAHRSGALIPTIHSRTRMFTLPPLDEKIMQDLIGRQKHALSPSEIKVALHHAQGSFGTALEYIEHEGAAMFDTLSHIFDTAPAFDWKQIYALSEDLSGTSREGAYESFQRILLWLFHQLAIGKAHDGLIKNSVLEKSGFAKFAKDSPLKRLLDIAERLQAHFDMARDSNLDKKQVVSTAFSIIKQ